MPIVLAVIAVFIIGGTVAYFVTSPAESEPTAVTQESPLLPDNILPDNILSENSADSNADHKVSDVGTNLSESDLGELNSSESEANVIEPEPEPVPDTDFVDGTYTESYEYRIPSNDFEPVTLTLTVTDDVVTDSTIAFDTTNEVSTLYQGKFGEAYKAEVVGKKLADISLSRVGGASLASRAFNKAVENIKAQADR